MKSRTAMIGWGVRVLCWGAVILGYAEVASAGEAEGPIYRHHYVGRDTIWASTNGTKLKAIWELAATAPFVEETLGKLAKAPRRIWQKALPAEAGDQADLIKPLLGDLLAAESLAEVRGPAANPEIALAVRVGEERAGVWETNLWALLQGWKVGTPRPVRAGEAAGWELRQANGGERLIQLLRAGEWVLVGLSKGPGQLLPEMLGKLSRGEAGWTGSSGGWLRVEADLAKLGAWLPVFAGHEWPAVELTVAGEGEDLRTQGRLVFPDRLVWNDEPWLIPTNRIVDPICSFTVVQGVAQFLKKIPRLSELGWDKLPNQFCSWGLPTLHSQSYLCVPVNDASKILDRLAARAPDFFAPIFHNPDLKFLYASNRSTLFLTGFPFINPHVKPIREGGTDYLLASFFQMPLKTNPPPAALFEQLAGRKNLAYYDWEITEKRIIQAKQFYQLLGLVYRRQVPMQNWPSQQWLTEVGKQLGNAVTELTVAGPRQLELVRRSHLGLTGFELVTLVRWIESPGFPVTYESQPPMKLPEPPARKKDPGRP